MLQKFTDFILKNRMNAIVVTLVCAFIPLVGTISILIAGLVTLRRGAYEGTILLMVSSIPYFISYFAYPHTAETQLALNAMLIMLMSNVLTWVFALLLRKYNWSVTLQIAALGGVVVVVMIHLLYPNIQAWWQTQLAGYLNKTAALMSKIKETNNADTMTELLAIAKQYATGYLVICVLVNALLQLVLARWWEMIVFNRGGLQKELHRIRFHAVFGLVFVIGLALSYWHNTIAIDAMPILYLTLCAAGLSLIHGIVGLAELNWLWLILIYVGAIGLFPLSVVILSMIGLLDMGFDFRKRFGNKLN